jgi:hypothetical protein
MKWLSSWGGRIAAMNENRGGPASLVQKGSFTTHDAENPDFQLRATTVRVYENDRAIMKNVTLYVGRVPIFLLAVRLSVARRRFQLRRLTGLHELMGPDAAQPADVPDH